MIKIWQKFNMKCNCDFLCCIALFQVAVKSSYLPRKLPFWDHENCPRT